MTAETALMHLPPEPERALEVAGRVANTHAAAALFADYRSRKAANTLRRQDNALALFAGYLAAAGIPEAPDGADLAAEPAAWRGVTWGLVAGFARWLLGRSYAIGSVNTSLSTVKTYARLAMQAGSLDRGEYVAIRAVQGYSRTEGKRVDEARPAARVGAKKAEPVPLSWEQIHRLKNQRCHLSADNGPRVFTHVGQVFSPKLVHSVFTQAGPRVRCCWTKLLLHGDTFRTRAKVWEVRRAVQETGNYGCV